MKGVLYKEMLESKETITAERYSNQLLKVNEKLQDLRLYSGDSARKIILLHDNARSHIGSFTKKHDSENLSGISTASGLFTGLGTYRLPSVQVSGTYTQASTSKIEK